MIIDNALYNEHNYTKKYDEFLWRKPENKSSTHVTNFKKRNVNLFYDNSEAVFKKFQLFVPHRTYNLDETELRTIQTTTKILTKKGINSIDQISSEEKGLLITVRATGNAVENYVLSFFVFFKYSFQNVHVTRCLPHIEDV